MKTIYRIAIFLLLLSGIGQTTSAQVSLSTYATNAGGNSFIGDDYHIEWSIGEMVAVNTSFDPTIIVSKGILQPQGPPRIINDASITLKVYPSLFTGNTVLLSGGLQSPSRIDISVYNSIGQKISSRTYNQTSLLIQQPIEVNASATGAYYVEVMISSNENPEPTKKTFRIQKINQ